MDTDLVNFVEARAKDLRLRYSRYLAPKRLLARVLEVEHRGLDRLRRTDAVAGCFGSQFAGYQDPACAVCQLQTACLTRTTAQVLPEHEAKVGADTRALAADMDLPWLAVCLMHALREALLEQDDPEFVDVAVLRRGVGRKPLPDLAPFRNPPKRPPVASVDACHLGARAAETGWPPPMADASHRLGLALKDVYVLPALARTLPRLRYGSPTWQRRVERDRRRLPELNWLPDGSVLRRVKKGELVEVRVFQDRLEWRNEVFATLYEVTAAICGRVEIRMPRIHRGKEVKGTRKQPRMSARRFFDVCFMQLEQRAAALQHMRQEHPQVPSVLPQPAFTTCPVCQKVLATPPEAGHKRV